MSDFFGYLRVSTARQGQGVSLAEQRDAIDQYARRNALRVVQWFEEQETAARAGRPIFSSMLKLLRRRKAAGVIIHKVDRSSRNFRDWADIGDLVDFGIDVRFATEGLDLQSRGGRIAADMLAVVAADYIRNLREETKKGMRGRYKQGLYPLPAPVGYLDRGPGRPKEIDPVAGPLVCQAFELYATGAHSLTSLQIEMARRGLRSRSGRPVVRSALARMLRNPFYIGIIQLQTTGETYAGVHARLVRKALFDQVQSVLAGKAPRKVTAHDFLFRRMLSCQRGHVLTGERQKGNVYYRCHHRACAGISIREEVVDHEVRRLLSALALPKEAQKAITRLLAAMRAELLDVQAKRDSALSMRLTQAQQRLGRLTDALIDGRIDDELFQERKRTLLMERAELEAALETVNSKQSQQQILDCFKLANSAYVSYEMGNLEEKREVLDSLTSNRVVEHGTLVFTVRKPFDAIEEHANGPNGGQFRSRVRTLEGLVAAVGNFFWKDQIESESDADSKEDNKLTGFGKG